VQSIVRFVLGMIKMAGKKKRKVQEKDLEGFKYLELLEPFLDRLHEIGTERDSAGNRDLYFDQYTALILLYFFSPIVTSLRGLQQATELKKVQKRVGISRVSLGSLSEASRVFDADSLQGVIAELADRALPLASAADLEALKGLTAVDGSLLPALPRMAWALWVDEEHRAAKMHLAFEVLRGVPVKVTVTEGNGSEKNELRKMLEAGRLYVVDRGYAEYQLFQEIIDADSSFVGRIRNDALWTVTEERPLTSDAKAAGVLSDRVVWLGGKKSRKALKQCLRVVEVATGKTDSKGNPEVLLLATDCMDLGADLIALAYRYRWSVELFFRWFKCILGCQHLLSHGENGVEIQVYVAIIASLLVSLWTGKKPTKRTFEMLCFFFCGMADEDELIAHLNKLKNQDA
jgi:hypothetical protein